MIGIIRNLFKEMSLIKEENQFSFYVSFNRNFNFFIFCNRQDFYQVKISSERPLQKEYEALKTVNQAIPTNVPQLIGFYQKEGFEILVCKGIKHRKIKQSKSDGEIVWREVRAILKPSKAAFEEKKPSQVHMDELKTVFEYFKYRPFSVQMGEWLRKLDSGVINSLPHIKQHGDFTLNNMGLEGDRLIIFDWEDFGKITIPGFDIFCLTVDLLTGFDKTRIERISKMKDYPIEIIELIGYFCNELSIDMKLYFNLYPAYVLCFLYLKEKYEYSREIISKVENVCNEMLGKWLKM